MINLKNIVSKSLLALVDTIDDGRSINRAWEFAKYNSAWIEEFDTIVYSVNGDKEWVDRFQEDIDNILRKPTVEILYSENLGHTFGTFDNDRKIFDYSKDKDYEYIWKLSNDVIANESIFDVEIDESKDFFYVNNIGYTALADTTKKQLIANIKDQSYFYPQTNYYIIKNKIKNWFPSYEEAISLRDQFEEKQKDNPKITPWAAIENCDCEHMLAKTIKENNLQSYHLLSDIETENIVNFVHQYKVGDGSHKNVLYENLGGLCHYHVVNHPVANILPSLQTFISEEEYVERKKENGKTNDKLILDNNT
jgi:hypothetical protein